MFSSHFHGQWSRVAKTGEAKIALAVIDFSVNNFL